MGIIAHYFADNGNLRESVLAFRANRDIVQERTRKSLLYGNRGVRNCHEGWLFHDGQRGEQ